MSKGTKSGHTKLGEGRRRTICGLLAPLRLGPILGSIPPLSSTSETNHAFEVEAPFSPQLLNNVACDKDNFILN